MHDLENRHQKIGTSRPDSTSLFSRLFTACVKRVNELRITYARLLKLSTSRVFRGLAGWKSNHFILRSVHTYCMRFYPYFLSKITELNAIFSPLSTPLIIKTTWVNKENLLIGKGG